MRSVQDFLSQRIEELDLFPPAWEDYQLGSPDKWPSELRMIFNTMLSSPVAGYILWGDQNLFFFNKAYQPLLFAKSKSAFGRPFFEVWSELKENLSPLVSAVKGGESYFFRDFQLPVERRGYVEEAFFDFSYSPVRNSEGIVIGVQCTCSETTEKVQSEKARATAEEERNQAWADIESQRSLLLTSLNEAPIAVALLEGREHVFKYYNGLYSRLVGDRNLLELPIRKAFPELSGQGFYELLDQVYTTGETFIAKEIEAHLVDRDKKPFKIAIELIYAPRRDQNGEIAGIGVFAIDISDKVQSRLLSEKRERFLNIVMNNIPSNIAYIDSNLKVQFLNEGTLRNFGKSLEDTLDKPIKDLFTEEQFQARLPYYKKALGGEPQEHIAEYTNVDGSLRITKNNLNPDIDANGIVRGFVGIGTDITQEIILEQEILASKNEAEMANSAKSAFLANMSHEIRSPLGAMMGFISLLRDTQVSVEDAKHYLDIITRNSQQVIRIIDDILDLSKVEAGKMTIESFPFSLKDVIADFASIMGFRAKENGIEFIVHAETELPDEVNSDPTRLRQILTNVVGNAIKFTREGRVTLSIHCAEDLVTFTVQDTGIGIDRWQADKLFQAFHQADASTTRKYGGTGLGLILTRKLCEAMGGEFWLEKSQLGQGSTFIATVRMPPSSQSTTLNLQDISFLNNKADPSKVFEGKRILVVDDSPDNLLLIGVILRKSGAEVETATDGKEGVEAALSREFDLVIMDVQMPRMGGYEAVSRLRELNFRKPIIALTAHAMVDERERCLNAGYSNFLSKPIDRKALLTVIKDEIFAK